MAVLHISDQPSSWGLHTSSTPKNQTSRKGSELRSNHMKHTDPLRLFPIENDRKRSSCKNKYCPCEITFLNDQNMIWSNLILFGSILSAVSARSVRTVLFDHIQVCGEMTRRQLTCTSLHAIHAKSSTT